MEMFIEDLAPSFSELNASGVDYATQFQTDIMDWLATFDMTLGGIKDGHLADESKYGLLVTCLYE